MGKRQRTFPDAPQPKRSRTLPPQPPRSQQQHSHRRSAKSTTSVAPHGKKQKHSNSKSQSSQQHETKPIIPFGKHDKILLVGEGDLSFAASLVQHHGCTHVTATVMEKDHEELVQKYPHVDKNINTLLGSPRDGLLAVGSAEDDGSRKDDASDVDDAEDFSDDEGDAYATNGHDFSAGRKLNNKLIYNIDATRPPPYLCRPANQHHHIIFNFPHVGGKSTDVNRQVRHNQSLLVSFFQKLVPALLPGGSIIVTLFEGQPYTLWNIKDLARHSGLAVERSFKFQASLYPGYRHARTLGVVRRHNASGAAQDQKGEDDEEDDGAGRAGWKGEERPARSFVFRRKGEVPAQAVSKKRKADDSSDDEQ